VGDLGTKLLAAGRTWLVAIVSPIVGYALGSLTLQNRFQGAIRQDLCVGSAPASRRLVIARARTGSRDR
jgi:hypothetical protein